MWAIYLPAVLNFANSFPFPESAEHYPRDSGPCQGCPDPFFASAHSAAVIVDCIAATRFLKTHTHCLVTIYKSNALN